MGKFFSDEVITQVMLEGLKEGLRQELRERIVKQLEDEIESVVESVVLKLNCNACTYQTPYDLDKKIMLDVLFTKVNEHKVVQEHTMTIKKES